MGVGSRGASSYGDKAGSWVSAGVPRRHMGVGSPALAMLIVCHGHKHNPYCIYMLIVCHDHGTLRVGVDMRMEG